ncbi:CDP-glucose 4,6-dehydratase [Megasphaera sueciensis]|uniref:CDP-glucose 4,6-dehydratase n=1 Tax=Megasphaera sueciensis TaxID=349094 RepID=UPI003D06B158
MENMVEYIRFFHHKRVLVTGHTGFKGLWLCKILEMAGAHVIGYAMPFSTAEGEKAFCLSGVGEQMTSVLGDVRNYETLNMVFDIYKPQIVFHLAAQPLVLKSYEDPLATYATNIMGTIHLLECVRHHPEVISVLNVTTDKVYDNQEQETKQYSETDRLDGYDPYSNSKSCSDIVTHGYKRSFFDQLGIAVSTVRAGNVIGGADFAENRIIPDCIRSAVRGEPIVVRNPSSVRPYQYVLEALSAYLLIAYKQYKEIHYAGAYNVGPGKGDYITTGTLVEYFCQSWGGAISWKTSHTQQAHEASYLKLDCRKIENTLQWQPKWDIHMAVEKTVEWAKLYYAGGNIAACMARQIQEYFQDGPRNRQ